jgi:ABC-type multidrug transport system fused ATPase/permease subunit
VLDRGRVVEHGSRAGLAAQPTSRYARLLRAAHGRTFTDDALAEEATA